MKKLCTHRSKPDFFKPTSRKMILSIFFLSLSFFQVNAAPSEKEVDPKVTIEVKGEPLRKVLDLIEDQTFYHFFYSSKEINLKRRIDISAQKENLSYVLKRLFRGSENTYSIFNDQIILKKEPSQEIKRLAQVYQEASVIGTVKNAETGLPLPGAVVIIGTTKKGVISNSEGRFIITGLEAGTISLTASYLGFEDQTKEVVVLAGEPTIVNFDLTESEDLLQGVLVTGYYSLPKERATGSYTHITADELEEITSLSLKDKLEGLVPGLLFEPNYNSDQNPTTERSSGIVVRGRSTLGDNSPLIVVDGFPVIATDGVDPWSTINPEDVENVTVLKDAAAASIWGAQAANGVIVITTKDGSGNRGSSVNVSFDFLAQPAPDLYEIPFASSEEAIEIYRYLFQETTFFDALKQDFFRDRYEFPEVVDVFVQLNAGDLSEEAANQKLAELGRIDVRDEFSDLFYRTETHKRVNVAFSNGSESNNLRASIMALQSDEYAIGDRDQQIIGNLNDRFRPVNWFSINFGVNFSLRNSENNGVDIRDLQYIPQMSRILDDNGDYLPMIKNNDDYYYDIPTAFRRSLVEEHNLPYDWDWNLKREIDNQDRTEDRNDLRLNAGFEITPFEGLSAEVSYQYQNNMALNSNYLSPETWYVRNAVNENYRPETESFPVPVGGMLYERRSSFTSHNARAQLTFDRTFGDHDIRFLAGTEIRSDYRESIPYGYYGYDPQSLTHVSALNFKDEVNPKLHGDDEWRGSIPPIPTLPATSISLGGRNDRFLSYYGNVAYTYKRRYDITGSIRLDQTNLYGRSASYRELPQWSTGVGYTVSNEPFFDLNSVNYLRFRFAYGWNGNIDKSASPFINATPWIDPVNQSQYAAVLSTPNPGLTWEKTANFNLGMDFGLFNNRIKGLLEVYTKKSTDVLADFEVNPTYGFYYDEATLNQGDINNNGFEAELSALVIDQDLKWRSMFNYSHNVNKVVNVKSTATNMAARTSMSQFYPVAGQPVDYLAVAEWAGYSDEGLPQVYYQGEVQDITEIPYIGADLDDLFKFVGQRSPKHFGSWINSFSYGGFELSARLLYSFGHKFLNDSPPRNSLYSYQRFSSYFTFHPELAVNRWQSPADNETASMYGLGTKVASYTATLTNDYIAEYNTSNVLNAGQVRLQSISMAYNIPTKFLGSINSASIQLQAKNLGPIFLVNDEGIDPSFPRYSGSLYSAYYNVIRDRPEYSVALRVNL